MNDSRLSDAHLAKQVSRSQQVKALAWILAATAAALIIGLLIYLLLLIRSTQIEGTPTGKKLLQSAQSIASCTTPGGSCYERTARNQDAAVRQITNRTVYAISCGQGMPDAPVRDVLKCVDDLIAQETQ